MKSCQTCLYALTHEKCDGCLGPVGTTPYLYQNWLAGDGVARQDELQRTGERSIVIGGQGEAEVNVKTPPGDVFKNLCRVAEQCGYSVRKGQWGRFSTTTKELEILMPHGHFRLIWWNDSLHAIERVITRTLWHCVK